MAPPRIKIINHELRHEIFRPPLLEAVLENEAARTDAKDRHVAIEQLFITDRFIEAFAQSEILRACKWAREFTAISRLRQIQRLSRVLTSTYEIDGNRAYRRSSDAWGIYLILSTWPGLIEESADRASGTSGSRSRKRLVGAQRIKTEIVLPKVLLIGDILIDCDEYIKTSTLGRIEKAAIFQTRQLRESGCLAIMSWKQQPQPLIDTLIDQKAHQQFVCNNIRASSSAATANYRGTVGNPFRNSSSVSPPSR